MNENLVEAAKDLKKFLATFDTDTEVVVYRDPAIEEILGEPETRRQRPDLFEDEEPDAP